MDSSAALGGAGRVGSAGRTGSGGGGPGRIGSGGGSRDNPFALGGGGLSAAAWTRLVSSGVEDELLSAGGGSGWRSPGGQHPPLPPQGHFLETCFLCRKPLASNRDIFMYRGDIPFCTEECRREQIEMDEETERKETASKKVAQRSPSSKGVESPPGPPKARAGSILAG